MMNVLSKKNMWLQSLQRISFLFFCCFMGVQTYAEQTIPEMSKQSHQQHVGYWSNLLKTNPLVLIRKNAAGQLGHFSDTLSMEALKTALQQDTDESVRMKAAESIGLLGDPQGITALKKVAYEDTSSSVQKSARLALYRIQTRSENLKKKREKLENTMTE